MKTKVLLLIASYLFTVAHASDEKKEWVISCLKDKFTDELICASTKRFPEWQGATPQIPISVGINRLGHFVIFSHHDHPEELAKIRIDSNKAYIQGTNVITGQRAIALISEMQSGTTGSISTKVWRNLTYDFDFSLAGFSESLAKLNEAFKNYK